MVWHTLKKPSPFFSLPKPPELTEEQIKEFGLLMNTGFGTCVNKPVWEGSDVVWATAVCESTPTYRVYNGGTNCLILLKYFPTSNTWNKVSVNDIDNLYGFLWTLIMDIYSEERKAHWKIVDDTLRNVILTDVYNKTGILPCEDHIKSAIAYYKKAAEKTS